MEPVNAETEALFLEVLAEHQVSVPELGRLEARHVPLPTGYWVARRGRPGKSRNLGGSGSPVNDGEAKPIDQQIPFGYTGVREAGRSPRPHVGKEF